MGALHCRFCMSLVRFCRLLAAVDVVSPCNWGPEGYEERYEGPVCLLLPQSLRDSLETGLSSTLLVSGGEYSGALPPNHLNPFSPTPPQILVIYFPWHSYIAECQGETYFPPVVAVVGLN